MAMRLSDVKGKQKVTTIEWDGETVDVAYLPNMVTTDLIDGVQDAAAEGDVKVIGALLEPILEWWDVLDDDGQRLPTDAATIGTIPLPFLNIVMEGIQGAVLPPASRG